MVELHPTCIVGSLDGSTQAVILALRYGCAPAQHMRHPVSSHRAIILKQGMVPMLFSQRGVPQLAGSWQAVERQAVKLDTVSSYFVTRDDIASILHR